MFPYSLLRTGLVLFLVLSIICNYVGLVNAQSLQETPYSASDSVRRGLSGPLDMSPSNPLGLPGSSLLGPRGSDSIPISSGMFQGLLPNIPNLQLGYIYNFGQSVRAGRASIDYLLPINLNSDTTVYGETHAEFQSFWKTLSGANSRTDISIGGGYRRMLDNKTLVGINGFYDTSRLFRRWYSSGSVGIELAAEIAGNDAIDINANWYGRLFNSDVLSNAFRYGPSNYDFQAGYSHELWNNGPDLRLSATGYKFDVGSKVYGYYGQGELKSRDGMFVLKSNVGYDRLNQTYYTVGAYINMGFQVENLLSGKSPLTMPEPIFKSPRNLRRMLSKTTDRNWYQPTSVVVNREPPPDPPTPTPPGPTPPTPTPPTPTPPGPEPTYIIRTTQGTLTLGKDDLKLGLPYYSSNIGLFNEGPVSYSDLQKVTKGLVRVTVSGSFINIAPSYINADTRIVFGEQPSHYGSTFASISAGSPAGTYEFNLFLAGSNYFTNNNIQNPDRMLFDTWGAIPPPNSIDWSAIVWFYTD